MDGMQYEIFLRKAFGFALDGKMIGRGEDPAGIAEADDFYPDKIHKVKAGIAYSMEIITSKLINSKLKFSDEEIERIENFTKAVIDAGTINKIYDLFMEYSNTVLSKYIPLNKQTGYMKIIDGK